jgi:hypothetical protein
MLLNTYLALLYIAIEFLYLLFKLYFSCISFTTFTIYLLFL